MKSEIILILGILIIFNLLNFVSADIGDEYCGMGSMMYGSYGTGPFLFSWIISILIIVALALIIVWLIKQIQKPARRK